MIGSFATHDDISPMNHGGVVYCNLTSGLQATLPMLNPYIVDGFQSGDHYDYSYRDKHSTETSTDNHEMTAHQGKLDIFNLSRKPGGDCHEIGKFMTACFALRDKYDDVITRGSYIILDKKDDPQDKIIAFARAKMGKTLLVIANKNVDRPIACKIEDSRTISAFLINPDINCVDCNSPDIMNISSISYDKNYAYINFEKLSIARADLISIENCPVCLKSESSINEELSEKFGKSKVSSYFIYNIYTRQFECLYCYRDYLRLMGFPY